jgi:hypothetical protein
MTHRGYIAHQHIGHDRNMLPGTSVFGTNTFLPSFSILEVYSSIDVTPVRHVNFLNIISLISCSPLPIRRIASITSSNQANSLL